MTNTDALDEILVGLVRYIEVYMPDEDISEADRIGINEAKTKLLAWRDKAIREATQGNLDKPEEAKSTRPTASSLDEILPHKLTYTHKQWVEAKAQLVAYVEAAMREARLDEAKWQSYSIDPDLAEDIIYFFTDSIYAEHDLDEKKMLAKDRILEHEQLIEDRIKAIEGDTHG